MAAHKARIVFEAKKREQPARVAHTCPAGSCWGTRGPNRPRSSSVSRRRCSTNWRRPITRDLEFAAAADCATCVWELARREFPGERLGSQAIWRSAQFDSAWRVNGRACQRPLLQRRGRRLKAPRPNRGKRKAPARIRSCPQTAEDAIPSGQATTERRFTLLYDKCGSVRSGHKVEDHCFRSAQ
jgi:hypothetical protein